MQCCALCNTRLSVEGGCVRCWLGEDHRFYCCREHADFAMKKTLAVIEPLVRAGF